MTHRSQQATQHKGPSQRTFHTSSWHSEKWILAHIECALRRPSNRTSFLRCTQILAGVRTTHVQDVSEVQDFSDLTVTVMITLFHDLPKFKQAWFKRRNMVD